jgi:glutathione S-transferase
MTDTKGPQLTLYRGFADRNCYVWSPFVTKVEFHLRLGGLSYQYEEGSPRESPKGKVPYIDVGPLIGMERTLVSDSALIVKHLVELDKLPDLNASLSGPDAAMDLALRALLEEKLYFLGVCHIIEVVSKRIDSGLLIDILDA